MGSDFITPEEELELVALEALWRETIIAMEKEINEREMDAS